MPWSLRAANCLSCSMSVLSVASGTAASSSGEGAGGASSAWAAAALLCADLAPMLAAVPATTAVVAIRATGRRRRNGMSIASCFVLAPSAGAFGADGVGLRISVKGVGKGAHRLFDDLARDSCAFQDDSVCLAHCCCERGRPGVLPDEQRC